MKIGIIASIWIRTPPINFGFGAQEYLAYHLTEELVKRGHQVTLFASGDSTTTANLVSITDTQVKDIQSTDAKIKDTYELMNLTEAYKQAHNFDVFHNHLLPFGMFFADLSVTPTVHTLHHQIYKNRGDYPAYLHFRNQSFISISHAQKSIVPELHYVSTVYNGVDTEYYTFQDSSEDYLLYIGRIKRYKGIHTAIQLAKKLKKALKIASPLPQPTQRDFKEVSEYWEKDVKPQVGGMIEYVGSVEGEEKLHLLQQAKALLFPVEREEPFGMTLVEAMSTGTPVIAYANGATPEIIQDSETGFLVKQQGESSYAIKSSGIEGLENAIQRLYMLSDGDYKSMRLQCRKRVESLFTIQQMVNNYEAAYKQVLTSK